MYICVNTYDPMITSALVLRTLFTLIFETGFLTDLEVLKEARLAGRLAPGVSLSLPPNTYHHIWLYFFFYVGSEAPTFVLMYVSQDCVITPAPLLSYSHAHINLYTHMQRPPAQDLPVSAPAVLGLHVYVSMPGFLIVLGI